VLFTVLGSFQALVPESTELTPVRSGSTILNLGNRSPSTSARNGSVSIVKIFVENVEFSLSGGNGGKTSIIF